MSDLNPDEAGMIEDIDLGIGADNATSNVDVDVDDAALADLINEAENLMNDLDEVVVDTTDTRSSTAVVNKNNKDRVDETAAATATATMMIAGNFSIDDMDDDDDIDPLQEPITTTTTTTTTTSTNTNTSNGGGGSTTTTFNDHPLSAVQLSSPPAAAGMMSAASAAAAPPTITTATYASNSMPFNGNTGNSHSGSFGGNLLGTMNSHLLATQTAAVSVDAFTKRTSVFASNLASMAQRGIAQVTAATGPGQPIHVLGGPSVTAPPTPITTATQMNSAMQHQPQQQHQHQHQQYSGYPLSSSATLSSSVTSSYLGGGNAGGAIGTLSPGMPTSQMASGSVGTAALSNDLDKEQKQKLIGKHIGQLFLGERVIMFLSNLLHVSDTSGASFIASQSQDGSMWCCVMTYYRLILFSTSSHSGRVDPPPGWDPLCWPDPPNSSIKVLEIPLAAMDRVEKTVYQAGGSSYMGIVIHGKDCGRKIQFTTPSYADTGRAFESLNTYAFPGRRNLGYLFAFESKRTHVMASVQIDETTGHQQITIPPFPKRFDPLMEFPRLLQSTGITQSPWTMWHVVNSKYLLSPSYPSVLVGPASLDENKPESLSVIRQCAAFRSEQRLPSMTWCGPGGASIWRSSQPKVGLQGNRSPADELYIRHISESARGANAMADPPPVYPRSILQQLTGDYSSGQQQQKVDVWIPEQGCGLKIIDLRPRSAAMANRTAGYGYENTSNYANCTLQFCNVQNIHAVRDSYQKLNGVCNGESTADVSFNPSIEDTKWLSHIRTILAASWETAYWVHVWRMPVLVHCSHGWDRTSQVACLAQLFLDPYYRTQHGFGVLIEKDFMSFGHPFHLRSAHGEGRSDVKNGTQSSVSNDEGQISPIFLQFLDCVYQLVHLYPNAFEFNTRYLLELSFHIYSCRFGNMLCDTERERELLAGIRQRTYSLWDHLESNSDWTNTNYQESSGAILMPLPTLLRNVHLWQERHCYFSPKPTMMKTAASTTLANTTATASDFADRNSELA